VRKKHVNISCICIVLVKLNISRYTFTCIELCEISAARLIDYREIHKLLRDFGNENGKIDMNIVCDTTVSYGVEQLLTAAGRVRL
jgi:hypothetical protein